MSTPPGFHVQLRPSGHRFQAAESRSVLQAGLDAGFSLPYSCRTGHCRSCRARVVSGRVDHAATPLNYLTPEQRDKGYALLCQARPLSDLELLVDELTLERIQPREMPCRVRRIRRLAPDVAALDLRLPMNENFRFAAGQFVDVLLADGRTRSYSMATVPKAQGVIDLEIHVRHVPGGLFTDRVFGSLREGELLRLRGPLGSFHLREDSDRPIVFLASGTGIAPILSMIGDAALRASNRSMRLYWGGRREADLYLPAPPGVPFVPVLSEQEGPGRTGFVHAAVMQDLPDLSGHDVYACGAPAMVEAARRDFIGRCGLPEQQFFADAFLTQADLP
ncbi:CDP-6-deoxy-delta-3,4-glucoseen reductase [Ramlibacter sp. AW1]|uniref:CDP-6-deoxy-delta-3,4-glucoseen reductase n=1 Tax=Ramlibacter aurantiacus TaxID=2801330 RepID=A0A936ZVG1_9BURK|nr:CDP-6-deoxy-delta-3,4-glucoseen reductase [Ramlibacter aurantiacus]MBL0421875.1 CDP-6-deoxy-delta-3,4-glucoseen reductase [Ramlibacter aurantiacus]